METIDKKEVTICELKKELDECNEARKVLKIEMESVTFKMVTLEEELFEAKTIQLDLLDKVEYLEPLEERLTRVM